MIVEPNDLKIGTWRRLNRKIDGKFWHIFIAVAENLKAGEVSSYICGFFDYEVYLVDSESLFSSQ